MKNRDLRKTKDLNPNIHINIAVVLAGGSGKRMKMKGSKQLIMIDDLPVFRHSVDLFKNLSEIHHVIVVYNPDYEREFQRWCSDIENISLVKCGDERYKSSFNALQYIDENFQNVNRVLIHDGARPFVKKELATRLLEFTCSTDCGVIPVIPVKDTIKRVEDGKV
ncbi:MAG: IspD/TarI family cytidylyltransferase, partial [Candidatus Muiribacteriaceae bacterium]